MHTGAIARELARSWLQFAQILRGCRQFSRGLHASYPFSLPPIYRYLLFIHPHFLPSLFHLRIFVNSRYIVKLEYLYLRKATRLKRRFKIFSFILDLAHLLIASCFR